MRPPADSINTRPMILCSFGTESRRYWNKVWVCSLSHVLKFETLKNKYCFCSNISIQQNHTYFKQFLNDNYIYVCFQLCEPVSRVGAMGTRHGHRWLRGTGRATVGGLGWSTGRSPYIPDGLKSWIAAWKQREFACVVKYGCMIQ